MRKTLSVMALLFLSVSLWAGYDYASEALWVKNNYNYTVDTPLSSIRDANGPWIAYKGTTAIDKLTFFTLANLPAQAEHLVKLQRQRSVLGWTSLATLATGVLLLALSPQDPGAQIGALCLGACSFALGTASAFTEHKIGVTFNIPMALQTAKQYNQTLTQ
ncbi:MAG: hypothetical protein WC159_11660 [Sphaerochaetaceae bacterium]